MVAFVLKSQHRNRVTPGKPLRLSVGSKQAVVTDPFHVFVGQEWAPFCGPASDDLLQKLTPPIHPRTRAVLLRLGILDQFEPNCGGTVAVTDARPAPAAEPRSVEPPRTEGPDPAPRAPVAPDHSIAQPISPRDALKARVIDGIKDAGFKPMPVEDVLRALRAEAPEVPDAPAEVDADRTIGHSEEPAPERNTDSDSAPDEPDRDSDSRPGEPDGGPKEPHGGESLPAVPEVTPEPTNQESEPAKRGAKADPKKADPKKAVERLNVVKRRSRNPDNT